MNRRTRSPYLKATSFSNSCLKLVILKKLPRSSAKSYQSLLFIQENLALNIALDPLSVADITDFSTTEFGTELSIESCPLLVGDTMLIFGGIVFKISLENFANIFKGSSNFLN